MANKAVLPVFRHPVVLERYMSQQSVLWAKAVNALRLHDRSISRRLRGLMLPLCSGHSCSSVPSSGLPGTRDRDRLERIQQKARKVRRELEHLSSQERLKGLGSVQSGGVKALGNLLKIQSYWKGGCQVDRLFSVPQAQTQTKEIPSEHQETLFHCEGH